MDSLCMCMCLLVWRNRTVSLPRGLLFSVLLCNFVSSSCQATTRVTANRIVVSLPVSLRILSIVLSSHREYSPILKTEQRSRYSLLLHRNHVSSRQTNSCSRCDREFSSACLPDLINIISTTIFLQVIRKRQSDETIRNLTKILAICPESGDRRIRFDRRVHRSPTRYSEFISPDEESN